jgi:glycosyltransferase
MTDLSIITVTLNGASTLADCLNSVKMQSKGAEHIIIDGGSTDGTAALLAQYGDATAQVVSEPDRGIYDAMNKGILLATGEVIGILNADDFYPAADILARVAAVFEDKQVQACYGDLVYVNAGDTTHISRYWRAGEYAGSRRFYHGWMPPHPTFFVRRSVYARCGLFNLELGSAADYELMLRFLVRYGITAVYIPEVLVHMRSGGVSNASLRNRLQANRMDRRAWDVNKLQPYPWTLLIKPLRKLGQWWIKC